MKRKNIGRLYILTVLMLISNFAFSQFDEAQLNVNFSLPEVALVDIEPNVNNEVNFTVNPSVYSGESPTVEQANVNLWVNYSSSLSSGLRSRSVVAEISQGFLPAGISLYLEASDYSGIGGGSHGQSAGRVSLNSQPKPIINNIGNCFTGDGINNGHSLTFSLEITDYTNIVSVENSNVLVLYTITDN